MKATVDAARASVAAAQAQVAQAEAMVRTAEYGAAAGCSDPRTAGSAEALVQRAEASLAQARLNCSTQPCALRERASSANAARRLAGSAKAASH